MCWGKMQKDGEQPHGLHRAEMIFRNGWFFQIYVSLHEGNPIDSPWFWGRKPKGKGFNNGIICSSKLGAALPLPWFVGGLHHSKYVQVTWAFTDKGKPMIQWRRGTPI